MLVSPFHAFCPSSPIFSKSFLVCDTRSIVSLPPPPQKNRMTGVTFPSFQVLLWWLNGSLCPLKIFFSDLTLVLLFSNLRHFFNLVSYRSEPKTTSSWKSKYFTLEDDISIAKKKEDQRKRKNHVGYRSRS